VCEPSEGTPPRAVGRRRSPERSLRRARSIWGRGGGSVDLDGAACCAVAVARLPYPVPTTEQVSVRMRQNRRRDSRAELALRSELHRRGLRFRVDLPIKLATRTVRPDVVFTRARLAVFVDGCFWHCCPEHGTTPRPNSAYWRPKLARNVARDREVDAGLAAEGWQVLRAWEHEDPARVGDDVERVYERSVGRSSG
jgi:DNA mismatch endonuclease, patch repair protein